jgi:hypothetical protein
MMSGRLLQEHFTKHTNQVLNLKYIGERPRLTTFRCPLNPVFRQRAILSEAAGPSNRVRKVYGFGSTLSVRPGV